METIKNNYQLSKTLRFGLTQKQNGNSSNTGSIYQSHSCLKELILISEKRIKENVAQEQMS